MENRKKNTLIIVLSVITVLILGGYVFYKAVFPKLAANILMGENAPEFMKQIQAQIVQNAEPFNKSLEKNDIAPETVKTILNDIEYSDIAKISSDLKKEGFKDKSACIDIILTAVDNPSVDKVKLKKVLSENLVLTDLEAGMAQFDKISPSGVKAALPVVKEIAGKALGMK